MASSFDTQVLFVPYRGGCKNKREPGPISQQKHAAREYHRKAKLRKQSQRLVNRPTSLVQIDSTSDDGPHTALWFRSESSNDTSSGQTNSPDTSQSMYTRIPSPRSILGAARTDPFDSAPVKNLAPHVHHMVDYAMTYQWPGWSFCNPALTIDSMREHMAHRLRFSQTSFFATIYAAATHYALTRVCEEAPPTNLILRLTYKDLALKMLLVDVKSTAPDMSIENMLVMGSLSAYGSGTVSHITPMKSMISKNALASAFDLNIYSRIPIEAAHFRAMSQIILRNGGLESLPQPGFAVAVALFDIFFAFRNLERPLFPLMEPISKYLDEFDCDETQICIMCPRLQLLLPQLPTSPKLVPIKPLLNNTLMITLAYEQHQRHDPRATTLRNILLARNCVINQLLELGSSPMFKISNAAHIPVAYEDIIYDIAWLSVLSYIALDLFPLTREYGPYEDLAQRLTVAIEIAKQVKLKFTQLVLFEWANELLGRLLVPSSG